MGNAETFGVIREKSKIKGVFVKEFSGSLSVGKIETIIQDIPSPEPLNYLDQIDNYYKEIKFSKAWSTFNFGNITVEAYPVTLIKGSIWNDFVPITRIVFEIKSDFSMQDLFDSITNIEKIKLWDIFRSNIARFYKDDTIVESYCIKFPFKTREFKDHFGIRELENGFEICSFNLNKKLVGKAQNYFFYWKIFKLEQRVCIQVIRHIELGIKNCKILEEIYAKFMYLSFKGFLDFFLANRR